MRANGRPSNDLECVGWIAIVALVGAASLGALEHEVSQGDSAWARRAEGEREGGPPTGPILEAVSAYESALAARPESLEARWKLLRALHFAGDFASQDAEEKAGFFERARAVSETGIELLSGRVSPGVRLDEVEPHAIAARLAAAGTSTVDVARLYFWSAINWGAWSRTAGILSAVRQGVADRIYRYTLIAIELEPGYDDGGPLRLLGRLHAQLPRVPFLSSWVRRDRSLPLLERAYALAPENPGNRLLLALTLLELAPERHAEAVGLLERVATLSPRPTMRTEDLAMREEARARLDAVRAKGAT
jgi:tetratricopeptide (TPR) repeat protein